MKNVKFMVSRSHTEWNRHESWNKFFIIQNCNASVMVHFSNFLSIEMKNTQIIRHNIKNRHISRVANGSQKLNQFVFLTSLILERP